MLTRFFGKKQPVFSLGTMEKVCDDAGSSWYYCPDDDKYYRVNAQGQKYRKISGQFLPNPEEVWRQKIGAAILRGDRPDVNKLKPTPAVYALWDHHKRRTT